MLYDHLGESFRLLHLSFLIAGSTDADSDIEIAPEYIERPTDAAGNPKRLVADAPNLLWPGSLFLFFLAPFVTISVARLVGTLLAMEGCFPKLLGITRIRT